MRGISWIEFLISFLVFLAVFSMLYSSLYNFQLKLISDSYYIDRFQKFLIASYYYLESKDPNSMGKIFRMFNTSFTSYTFPIIIIPDSSIISCYNCTTLYYNYTDESINFLQNVSLEYQTYIIAFFVSSVEDLNVNTSKSEFNCYNYLKLNNSVIKECSFKLIGNSTIKFYPVRRYIYIKGINSFANFSIHNSTIEVARVFSPASISGETFNFYADELGMVTKKILIIS